MFTLSLILISSLNWQTTLRADIPASLKPTPASQAYGNSEFFCVDRQGAESVATAYRENADCHAQLKTATSTTDWSIVIVGAALGLVTGLFVGQATK